MPIPAVIVLLPISAATQRLSSRQRWTQEAWPLNHLAAMASAAVSLVLYAHGGDDDHMETECTMNKEHQHVKASHLSVMASGFALQDEFDDDGTDQHAFMALRLQSVAKSKPAEHVFHPPSRQQASSCSGARTDPAESFDMRTPLFRMQMGSSLHLFHILRNVPFTIGHLPWALTKGNPFSMYGRHARRNTRLGASEVSGFLSEYYSEGFFDEVRQADRQRLWSSYTESSACTHDASGGMSPHQRRPPWLQWKGTEDVLQGLWHSC